MQALWSSQLFLLQGRMAPHFPPCHNYRRIPPLGYNFVIITEDYHTGTLESNFQEESQLPLIILNYGYLLC